MIGFHRKSGSLLLQADDPLAIRDLLPHSKLIDYKGYNVAVQHTLASTKVLQNIGFDPPAPIRFKYNWPGKYKPFDHQIEMAEFLTVNRRCFNLSEMGTMKTASALWAADWLMLTGRVKKCVIFAPLSTLKTVWQADLFDVLLHRTCSIVHGPREKRERALDADVDFYIINHEALTIPWLYKRLMSDPRFNLMILDEGSMFRNARTQKWKLLYRILKLQSRYRFWLATGTPCPQEPTDSWALTRLVNPSRVPDFFGSYQRLLMVKTSPFKWDARPGAYRLAYEAMQPAIRFLKKDCIDLPPVVTQDRSCTLSPKQLSMFKSMKAMMVAEARGQQINAVNAADKIGKLRQILCGAIKHPKTGEYITVEHSSRFDVMMEAIQGASGKIIVVAPFKGIIKPLAAAMIAHGVSVGILNGDVTPKERNKTIHEFKTQKDPHALLCHPKVMAHGLNLTEADTLIFYAPIYSNDEYRQVIERFNRQGQKRKMTIVRIGAHPIEWAIYRVVDSRGVTQDNILKLYKSVIT